MLWQARAGIIAGRGAIDAGSAAPTWQVAYSQALDLNSTGWSGFNLRMRVNSSLLALSGTQTRLTLQASTLASCAIDGLYIGNRASSGDGWDFESGTQVQVLVGGSATFTVSANTETVTDAIAFALDNTKDVIVAVHFNTTSAVRGANGITNTVQYNRGAANETATANVSGYSTLNNALRLVNKIEVFA